MSYPSQWPLPEDSLRYVIPDTVQPLLSGHPLSQELYPLAFGRYRRAAGHHMHREQHSDDLLIYCSDGEGFLNLAGEPYRIQGGDLVLLPAGVAHRYAANPARPWSIHWVHYGGTLARAFADHMGFAVTGGVLSLGLQPQLLADFEGLLAVQQSGYRADGLLHAANRLRLLLSGIPLLREQQHDQHGLDVAALHQYMREHLDERQSLQQLASIAGLSPAYFATLYRQHTGVSPIQHLLHLKIERACQLLDNSTLSVAAISQQLGYDDRYYFSRLFKRTMGQSPSEYRMKNR